MKATLVAVLLASGMIFPAEAVNVAKTYIYYSIGGATLDAILKQLDKRGPKVAITGQRHPGAMQTVFASRVSYQKSVKGCRVASASVTVHAKIILPSWRRPRNAASEVRLTWETLLADIKRHEESHVIIAKNHARLLEQALLAIPRQSNCEAALAKAARATENVLAKHNVAQSEFDRIEGINFESRMMRLLHHRIKRLPTGQKRG